MPSFLWVILFLFSFNISHASNEFHDFKHDVTLISAYETFGGLSAISVGLHFTFKDKWKTYWREPGVVGYPIKISTQGSQNIKSIQIHWPVPEAFTTYDLLSYGYSKEVVLPITVVLKEPAKPVLMNFDLDYLVCDPSNCVPQKAVLTLALSPYDATGEIVFKKSEQYNLIQSYLNRVPRKDSGKGMTIERAEIDMSLSDHHALTIVAHNPAGFKSPDLFIEPHADIYVDYPTVTISDDKMTATFVANVYLTELKNRLPDISLLHKKITLTLKDGEEAIESPRFVEEIKTGFRVTFLMLLFAFIGGFILNFMPCVLPVISIKVMSVLQQAGIERSIIRRNFLLTVLGILTSFWLIAALTIALKHLGYAVGWGIQFQEPLFLVSMILIIALFAFNLLGFFEIMLASSVATKIVAVETRESSLEYFLSGAFVTMLATPCTAPFLGTALSFALARGSIEILSMFTIMGFGLSLPFFLIALYPGMSRYLPKPGRWMVVFKKSLSVLLFATIIWLLWTLNAQKGFLAALSLGAIVIAIGFVLYLKRQGVRSRLVWSIISLLSILALSTPYWLGTEGDKKDLTQTVWSVFDEKKISKYVNEGKVVFIDVTADWCLTCAANEPLVLNTSEIQGLLSQDDVVAMQADWTKGDENITAFLRRFGKFGVPFYVVYGPARPDGLPLPEVLTTQIVLDAVKKARRIKEKKPIKEK